MTDGQEAAAPSSQAQSTPANGRGGAHEQELLRSLNDRVLDLRTEFEELIGKRGDGGKRGAVLALKALSDYPDHIWSAALEAASRPGRSAPLAAKLGKLSESVVMATTKVQEWFAGPYSEDVPVALADAVVTTCKSLGVGDRQAVISIGPPARIETIVSDVRESLYLPEQPPPQAPATHFALLTIPRHEGASPRWWPVVLGHELAHLRVRQDDPRAGGGTPAEDSPGEGVPPGDYPMLTRLGILKDFPFK